MIRILRFITVLIVVSSLLAAPIGTVEAQENNTTENTTTAEHDPNPEPEYLQQVDQNVRLMDWEYTGSEFRLVFEADRPTQVTITEAVQWTKGSGQMAIHQERLLPGQTTVTLPVAERNGKAGAVITTADSIGDGHGVYVSTGQTETNESPFERTSSTAGWIGGAGTVGFMFSFVAWREIRKEPSAPEVAE